MGYSVWWLNCLRRVCPVAMLAFDIETTGLSYSSPDVVLTCACAYDPEAGIAARFLPACGADMNEFFRLLDGADQLCAFNGAKFDIPFIQAQYGITDERVGWWQLKLFDVFQTCKLGLGRTFSLNALLEANGMPSKTDSGVNALQMAKDQDWDRLSEYCMQDTIKTYNVSNLDVIKLPVKAGVSVLTLDGFIK